MSETPPRSHLTRVHPPVIRRNTDSRTKLRIHLQLNHYDTFGRNSSDSISARPPQKRNSIKMQGTRRTKRLLPVSTETVIFFAFWLFGTVVTMQFGVVVTASNDLVGSSAPPGLILFAYTLPSILVRMLVPYITFPDITITSFSRWLSNSSDYDLISAKKITPGTPITPPDAGKGTLTGVSYPTRLVVCATASFFGLQLLAWSEHVGIQILGISLASLSSNLGDMSFFQLATRYPSMITQSFGGYATGSGAAGLIGSFVYTLFTTSFAVRPAAVISGVGVVPVLMLGTYFYVLPSAEMVERDMAGTGDSDERMHGSSAGSAIGSLRLEDKLQLVKPMIWGYMIPLAVLMFLENITTQGILPTVIWHIPLSAHFRTSSAGLALDGVFRTARDFYPTFFTIYQMAVFFGRTSITLFRLPGSNSGSASAYYGLCGVEAVCFLAMFLQSLSMSHKVPAATAGESIDLDGAVRFSPSTIGFVIFLMGLCGGLGMSNTYWRVSKKPLPAGVWQALEPRVGALAREEGLMTPASPGDGEDESYFFQRDRPRPRLRTTFSLAEGEVWRQMLVVPPGTMPPEGRRYTQKEETAVREFLISTIALPDTAAIMVASLVSLWLQPKLCQWQVDSGRELCRGGVM